ncbi:MAG TPA: AraC family transcriptional regulator [Bryobacteraceae bacterium]|jgi:AraC-like DNA-binding protein|nr:AraC family transcriptional regulator [Bryobacteraceae bacterium]
MQISGIKLLTNFADRDLVTDILRSVTFKTVVLGRAELHAPWGLHYDLPGRAVFHILLRGQCWLNANGANPVQMCSGDTILFPRADPHDISDHPATPIRPLQEMLIQHPMTPDKLFRYGGRGPRTTMLCGALHLDDPKLNLMGALLPPLLHLRSSGGQVSAQLRALTRCIETELEISRPGEQAIVTRMAEAFLLRAIRDHVLASSNGDHGLPAILRDPGIARVLGLIHQRPEHPWTVDALANEANLSRSSFAVRFKLRVGATPQSYLQRYRFTKAIQLLQTDAKMYEIAQRVGYDSESSFSKAFKRLTGKSPGAYRPAK